MLSSEAFASVTLDLFRLVDAQSGGSAWRNDFLERTDRGILVLRSGAIYRVLYDPTAIGFRLSFAQVIICDQVGHMGGEAVTYCKVKN
jgi:hypothetical protein